MANHVPMVKELLLLCWTITRAEQEFNLQQCHQSLEVLGHGELFQGREADV